MRRLLSALLILVSTLVLPMLSGCKPNVVNAIQDVVVAEGEPSRDLDLSTTFMDPNPRHQGLLTLTVIANTDPNVVTATLTGTTLTLDFQNSGSTTITIQAADPQGLTEIDEFTVTVQAGPRMVPPDPRRDVIGFIIADLDLQASTTNCNPCTFGVVGLPSHLQLDATTGRISGGIAYSAFTQGPEYIVRATATDGAGRSSPEVSFTWRIVQGGLEDAGGDGDGDGDSGDGDGGAGGDSGDGGDLSPLAGATCTFVDMNGGPFLDNQQNVIQDVTDASGNFLLTIPHDAANPDFVKALEGFVECHPSDKTNLVVSYHLNTKGLRKGERLRLEGPPGSPAVSPVTTVFRNISDGLDAAADRVAIQARLVADVTGLLTRSPQAVSRIEPVDPGCDEGAGTVDTVIDSITTPLQGTPANASGNRTGMAGYVASQLFLAAFKGELVDVGNTEVLDPDFRPCDEEAADEQTQEDFPLVLKRYFTDRIVTRDDLIMLGLKRDEGVVTAAANGGCG